MIDCPNRLNSVIAPKTRAQSWAEILAWQSLNSEGQRVNSLHLLWEIHQRVTSPLTLHALLAAGKQLQAEAHHPQVCCWQTNVGVKVPWRRQTVMGKAVLFALQNSKIEKKPNERVTEPAKAYRHTLQVFSFLPGSGANTQSVTEVSSCSRFSLQLWKVDWDSYTKIKSLTFIPSSMYALKKRKSSSEMSISTNNSKVILNRFILFLWISGNIWITGHIQEFVSCFVTFSPFVMRQHSVL